ncbi:MAG: CRTAC1 family protein [Planctomycetota bacterium]
MPRHPSSLLFLGALISFAVLFAAPHAPALPPPQDGGLRFADATAPAGLARDVRCGVAAAADYDRDGWPDLVMGHGDQGPLVLHNERDGTFKEIEAPLPLASGEAFGVSWVDLDGDRWLDILVASDVAGDSTGGERHSSFRFFRNAGGEAFAPASLDPVLTNLGGRGRFACPTDLDRDGRIDLLLMSSRSAGGVHRVARRTTDGFVDEGERSAWSLVDAACVTAVHLDQGKDPYYIVWGGAGGDSGRVYRRDPTGLFRDVSTRLGIQPASAVNAALPGDYDNDGDLDLYYVCDGANRLYRNDETRFADVAARAGVADAARGVAGVFADFDLDGDLDLYVVNATTAPGSAPSRLYENRGAETFTDVTESSGMASQPAGAAGSALAFDYDRDGDPDLLLTGGPGSKNNSTPTCRLLRNESRCSKGLCVELQGTNSDPSCMGARVTARVGDSVIELERFAATGLWSTSILPLIVGLGSAGEAVLEVTWPSGHHIRKRVTAGELIEIIEPEGPPPHPLAREPKLPLKTMALATLCIAVTALVAWWLARKLR